MRFRFRNLMCFSILGYILIDFYDSDKSYYFTLIVQVFFFNSFQSNLQRMEPSNKESLIIVDCLLGMKPLIFLEEHWWSLSVLPYVSACSLGENHTIVLASAGNEHPWYAKVSAMAPIIIVTVAQSLISPHPYELQNTFVCANMSSMMVVQAVLLQ